MPTDAMLILVETDPEDKIRMDIIIHACIAVGCCMTWGVFSRTGACNCSKDFPIPTKQLLVGAIERPLCWTCPMKAHLHLSIHSC